MYYIFSKTHPQKHIRNDEKPIIDLIMSIKVQTLLSILHFVMESWVHSTKI